MLAALLQQALHGLYCPSTGVQQTGKGSMRGRRRGLLCVGLEDDVNVGTAKAKGVDAHIATTNRQGPIHHLQPAIKEGWDFRVGVVEMQVGGPNPVLQGQQHLQPEHMVSGRRAQPSVPTWGPCAVLSGTKTLPVF